MSQSESAHSYANIRDGMPLVRFEEPPAEASPDYLETRNELCDFYEWQYSQLCLIRTIWGIVELLRLQEFELQRFEL